MAQSELRVRFIVLNNGVDTASNNMNAATTSVNVQGTLNVNRAQGKFIGSFPTYGYLKDPNDHHRLIIDEILIHEGGDITVKFKFNNAYKDAMEYIEMNKEIIRSA